MILLVNLPYKPMLQSMPSMPGGGDEEKKEESAESREEKKEQVWGKVPILLGF